MSLFSRRRRRARWLLGTVVLRPVPAPRPRWRAVLAAGALAAAVGVAGVALGRWHAPRPDPLADATAPDLQRLRQELATAQAALGVAQAHGSALEREVQALQQQLRDAREELMFFRRAGAARQP